MLQMISNFIVLTSPSSQLLELLLDINDSTRIPANQQYALYPATADAVTGKHREAEDGIKIELHRALREARARYESRRITKEDYSAIENELLARLSAPSASSLSSLLSVPHTHSATNNIREELLDDNLNGRMTPNHAEDYLNSLDAALSDGSEAYRMILKTTQQPPPRGLSEKDLALQNPNSVYHWLKKHQPQIFNHEKDLDGTAEKPAPTSKRLATKRSSDIPMSVSAASRDSDIVEDDIFYTSEPPKSKRTKDDEPYRPKGGSSKSAKRKRDELEKGSKRKKTKSLGGGAVNDSDITGRRLSGDSNR